LNEVLQLFAHLNTWSFEVILSNLGDRMGNSHSRQSLNYIYPPDVLHPTQRSPLPPQPLDLHSLSPERQQLVAQVLATLERFAGNLPAEAWQLDFATIGFEEPPAQAAVETPELEPRQRRVEYALRAPFTGGAAAGGLTRLDRAVGYIAKRIQSITVSGQMRPPYGYIVWRGSLVIVDGELSWDTERASYEMSDHCTGLASFALTFHRQRNPIDASSGLAVENLAL
jgi:hypothetical protein